METNKVIIQRVQSLYSKGVQSDNSRLSSRHIYDVLCSNRATLLSQEYKKNQRLSSYCYQVIDCVELETIILPDDCRILRSKYEIPATIVSADRHVIEVSTLNDGLTLKQTVSVNAKYKKGNRYTSKVPEFYIKDGYLYVTATLLFESVTIEGVFEQPLQAFTFKSCTPKNDCKSYLDYIFPMEKDLSTVLIQQTANELIGMFTQAKEDKVNNSQEDVKSI